MIQYTSVSNTQTNYHGTLNSGIENDTIFIPLCDPRFILSTLRINGPRIHAIKLKIQAQIPDGKRTSFCKTALSRIIYPALGPTRRCVI